MINNEIRHEIVSSNPDIEVRFYLSEDEGSYVAPHWHNSLELVYMLEGSMTTQFENNVRQTIEAGEISVVNPRVIHSVTAQKNKALVLLIPSDLLEKYIPAHDFLDFTLICTPMIRSILPALNGLKRYLLICISYMIFVRTHICLNSTVCFMIFFTHLYIHIP